MIGRRLHVFEDGSYVWPTEPGDYVGPVTGQVNEEKSTVYFLKPNARDDNAPPAARSIQCVTSPPHTFRECEDGSLEIRNSIGDTAGSRTESDGWHGFLDAGHVWRKV